MNSFSLAMLHQLGEAYTDYEDDSDARCAVLFAHGKNFTSGLRLDEVGPAFARGEHLFDGELVNPLGLHGRRLTKPVVCAVQGWCLTIGIELLLACDIRGAATDTRFGQIEVQRGIMPFGGATIRLPQIAGWGNAMRWLLTGGKFDAAEALRIGLVQEVAEAPTHLERAIAVAEEVARQAPLAVQASLRAARIAVEQGTDAAQVVLEGSARELMVTEDAAEGVRSFLERREANFKGR